MPDGVWKYDWGQNKARRMLLLLLRMTAFMNSGNQPFTWNS
jgi:hypothetical protein